MNIAILEGYTTNPGDLSFESFKELGNVTYYDRTNDNEFVERATGCDAIIINKLKLTRERLTNLPDLKFIGILATGFDNVDLEAAKDLGIAVCNVPAYASESAAQHTFALLLELTNHVALYDEAVKDGEWSSSPDFTFVKKPMMQLAGKSLGIIGYGNIGKEVGAIGEAFGMKVNVYSKDKEACIKSDIISLHCPLTAENKNMINKEFISKMKDCAILINTARGGLISEDDLYDALVNKKLAAAAIDVLPKEPPTESKLFELDNCIITPHISWMTKEARQKIIDISFANLEAFGKGEKLNRIV